MYFYYAFHLIYMVPDRWLPEKSYIVNPYYFFTCKSRDYLFAFNIIPSDTFFDILFHKLAS